MKIRKHGLYTVILQLIYCIVIAIVSQLHISLSVIVTYTRPESANKSENHHKHNTLMIIQVC